MNLRKLITTSTPSLGERIIRAVFKLGTIPYWLGATLKNVAYDQGWKESFRSPLLTISVGNLSVGGTGKSPVVAWLARELRNRELRVAILSRGYGQLDDGRNDEALELERLLPDVPHLQNPDRVAAAKLAEEELEMQVLLLDDAFQHRRIQRDLDIVLLDATDPPAAQTVLPRGLYREPFSAIRRAEVILVTRANQVSVARLKALKAKIARWNPSSPILLAKHSPCGLLQLGNPMRPVDELRGKRVLAFCGIGNPQAFFQTLEDLGAEVLDRKTWPDHHAYHSEDIRSIAQWAQLQTDVDAILCTMKDWVKIQVASLGGKPLLALPIELSLDAEDSKRLRDKLEFLTERHGRRSSQP